MLSANIQIISSGTYNCSLNDAQNISAIIWKNKLTKLSLLLLKIHHARNIWIYSRMLTLQQNIEIKKIIRKYLNDLFIIQVNFFTNLKIILKNTKHADYMQ